MASQVIGLNLMNKRTLCIQIQDVSLDSEMLYIDYLAHCFFAFSDSSIEDFQMKFDKKNNVLNLNFSSNDIIETWRLVSNNFNPEKNGCIAALKRKWIVVAQGDKEWDDYVLLDSYQQSI
ncbi:hypothetical protein [Diaphorobacter aerolatus]|uniref:Uncharacterized protein n=1 Tax=Diaphorobacter aerolatus TaxID=1288495 RepID=A0A7H0GKU3_9BURK|nr:hypothetical protein [Diaphorobacter aerolatus]QNP48909.1 hypothetical protein H9K75_01520 [Diaphorobacter aerolatus]